jgi:ATP adenylyltransferase
VEQLWSPWRLAYLSAEPGDGDQECFLCVVGAGASAVAGLDRAAESGVIWRGEHTYVLLNAYPYANGHVMVAPYEHEGDLTALPEEVGAELMAALRLTIRALRLVYKPEGFNVGANLGSAAGAGFGDHVHFHVVPRWSGDTNFMTTVGGSRVIPEKLEDTAARLRSAVVQLLSTEA